MNIADKLTTIANNAQKVNECNEQLAYAIDGINIGLDLQGNVNQLESDRSAIISAFKSKGVGVANDTPFAVFPEEIDKVYSAGAKSEYDKFWDVYQNNGGVMYSGSHVFYGRGWNDETFYPKYDIFPYAGDSRCYFQFNQVSNLRERIDGRGLKVNLSQKPSLNQWFRQCVSSEVPDMDTSKCVNFGEMFYSTKNLHTIPRLNLTSATSLTNTFTSATALRNITFEGTIPISVSFKDCSLLTLESLKSIINALADYTGTDKEFTYTLTLNSVSKTLLDDENTTIEGVNWRDYIFAKGWNLA